MDHIIKIHNANNEQAWEQIRRSIAISYGQYIYIKNKINKEKLLVPLYKKTLIFVWLHICSNLYHIVCWQLHVKCSKCINTISSFLVSLETLN
jgi:hypothetical protein